MQSIGDASVMKHFYTVWSAGDERMYLENFFAEIEGGFSKSRDRLLDDSTFMREDREAISGFMSTMIVRTPRSKRSLDEMIHASGMPVIDEDNMTVFALAISDMAFQIRTVLMQSRMVLAQWENYSVVSHDNPVMFVMEGSYFLFPVNHRSVLLSIPPGGNYRGMGHEGGTEGVHPRQIVEDSNNLAIRSVDRLAFAHPLSSFDLAPA